MIFVTVGEQLPFDRFIRAIDCFAEKSTVEIFAQIGRANYTPVNFMYSAFLSQTEFMYLLDKATLIVSHAGMGTIISAVESAKPILIMPRRASLGEHRNDHQLDTVTRVSNLSNVFIAQDEEELIEKLSDVDSLLADNNRARTVGISSLLLRTVRDFILTD